MDQQILAALHAIADKLDEIYNKLGQIHRAMPMEFDTTSVEEKLDAILRAMRSQQ